MMLDSFYLVGKGNYLPISILLFTFTALAIMIATTAKIITVVIIIHFLSFVEPPFEASCLTLSFNNLIFSSAKLMPIY